MLSKKHGTLQPLWKNMEMVPAMVLSIHAKDACTTTAYIRTIGAATTYSIWNTADHVSREKTAR